MNNTVAGPIFMWVGILLIFYFIMWRPQAQQRRKHEQLLGQLKRGDEVVTGGGVIGRVEHIQEVTSGKPGMDDRVTISSGTSRLVVERRSITRVGSAAAATTAASG
jgi:preprotein translocase subunit YajC